MTTRELLQMALDALTEVVEVTVVEHPDKTATVIAVDIPRHMQTVAELIRAHLAKPEPEPQYFVKFAGWPLEEVDKKLYDKTHKDNRCILYAKEESDEYPRT
jgi:hypothetical protein